MPVHTFRKPASIHKRWLTLPLLLTALVASTGAYADRRQEASEQKWQQVLRPAAFGDREIIEGVGQDLLQIKAPVRAEDAAFVPISIHALAPQTPERHIRDLLLYIDQNPIPLAGKFQFSMASGRADLALRVRVDDFTYIRAIAETNEGKLYMAKAFVRSLGGCSAPPGASLAASQANLGKIKIKTMGAQEFGQPNLVQLRISHPNITGLALDQRTRAYPPAYFVKELAVDYAQTPVLRGEFTFSLSQDPSLRFFFQPEEAGMLKVRALDTKGLEFTKEMEFPSTVLSSKPQQDTASS